MSVLGSAAVHQSMQVVFSEYFRKGRKVGKIPTISWNFCCEHISCNLSLVSKSDISPTKVFFNIRHKSQDLLPKSWRQMVWNITALKCKNNMNNMQSRAKVHEFDLQACCLVVTQSLSLTPVTFIILIFFNLFNHMCMCLWGPRCYWDRGYRELSAVSRVLWERNQSS